MRNGLITNPGNNRQLENAQNAKAHKAAGQNAEGREGEKAELIPDGLLAARLQSGKCGEGEDNEGQGENVDEGVGGGDPGGDVAARRGG